MGLRDFLSKRFGTKGNAAEKQPSHETAEDAKKSSLQAISSHAASLQAMMHAAEKDEVIIQSFDNSATSFDGDLSGYDYAAILKDKQNNMNSLYAIADYYTDADPLVHGIIKHVYVPYSICSPWVLSGAPQKTCKIYEEVYKRIRLREKLESIMLEYWKNGNVFTYWMNGNLITLPPNKCKIGNVSFNGEPIVDFDCMSVYSEYRQKGYVVRENWVKDNHIETMFKGYPKEIQECLNKGEQYAQLNPKYCHVMQGQKESWQRYAVPFIAACLTPLAKKELISNYETSMLNIGLRSFLHVKYGDTTKGQDIIPDASELYAVRQIFSKAMAGYPLAVTNQLVEAKFIQADTADLFQWDSYRNVNQDILSAGGISGILVTGNSEDGSTFATAQVSMETAAARIDSARDEFCELMNHINICIGEDLAASHVYNIKVVPQFGFLPLDMTGKKSLRETCMELWEKGLISKKTLMEANGYSVEKEKAYRMEEAQNGTDRVMVPQNVTQELVLQDAAEKEPEAGEPDAPEEEGEGAGRPELTDDERTSDPEAAMRGKLPKPSNPEGSM